MASGLLSIAVNSSQRTLILPKNKISFIHFAKLKLHKPYRKTKHYLMHYVITDIECANIYTGFGSSEKNLILIFRKLNFLTLII